MSEEVNQLTPLHGYQAAFANLEDMMRDAKAKLPDTPAKKTKKTYEQGFYDAMTMAWCMGAMAIKFGAVETDRLGMVEIIRHFRQENAIGEARRDETPPRQ